MMPEAKAISDSLLAQAISIEIDIGGRVRMAGVPAGTYTVVLGSEAKATIPALPLATLTTPPSITGSVLIGVPATFVNAVWGAAPAGMQIEIQRRVVVETLVFDDDLEEDVLTLVPRDTLTDYTPQQIDFGLPLFRQERARLVVTATGEQSGWTEWGAAQSSPVTVAWPQPAFTIDPSFGAAEYSVGQTITFNLGAAGPAATQTIEVFTLGAVDKASAVAGTGSNRTWNTTGEIVATVETVSLRVRATNPSGFVLSNTVTVPLAAVAAAIDLRIIAASAVFQGTGTGTISAVIAAAPGFNGTRNLDADALPLAHVAPRIVQITDEGSTGTLKLGDLVGSEPPFTTSQGPGVVAFDPTGGAILLEHIWQRDVAGNGTFADISGAPKTLTRVATEADQGNQLRRDDRATQGATTVNNPSNALAVVAAAASDSVDLQTPLVYDGTAINVHTFAAGFTAATDDTIVIGISARNSGGSQGVLAVTIGGQTMTVAAVTNASVLAGHAIRKLTAPISPTDEIVVTFAATGLYGSSRLMPWKCVGYGGAFHATATGLTTTNATSVSTTIDVPADGAVFVTQTNGNTTNNTGTMTGATKEVDELLGIRRTVAGHASGLSLEVGRTITVESPDTVARRLSAVTVALAA